MYFKNTSYRGSRGNEAQIYYELQTVTNCSEPHYVGCCNYLLTYGNASRIGTAHDQSGQTVSGHCPWLPRADSKRDTHVRPGERTSWRHRPSPSASPGLVDRLLDGVQSVHALLRRCRVPVVSGCRNLGH